MKFRAFEQDRARFGVTVCRRADLENAATEHAAIACSGLEFPENHGDSFPELCTSQTNVNLLISQ
jgi:hypothetical protein